MLISEEVCHTRVHACMCKWAHAKAEGRKGEMIKCVAIRVQMCQCAIGHHRYVFAKLSQSMINNNEAV